MTRREQLEQARAQLAGNMEALTAAAEAENRALTDEEQANFDKFSADFDKTEKQISNLDRTEKVKATISAPLPRQIAPEMSATQPSAPGPTSSTGAHPITGRQVNLGHAHHGFEKGFGEYLIKVRDASMGRTDPRLLVNAVTTWAGESVGADGGFALPPAFTQGIMSLVAAEDSFIRALNPFPTQSDIITVPKDEDAPWSTTAITAAKTSEGTAITASKPVVNQLKVPLYGIKALVHVDEKSLRDMTFLAAYVERKMGEKIRYRVENYVLNGTGENEPLGILKAPGLNTLTKNDSTTTSFGPTDLMNLDALTIGMGGNFWIAHHTALAPMRVVKSGTGGYPLYTMDFRNSPNGGLLGAPIYRSAMAQTFGTAGDLIRVNADGYFLAFEAAGAQNASTIAFAFDQNLQSFRSTLYMGGAPTLNSTVTLPDGSTKVSNLTVLSSTRT